MSETRKVPEEPRRRSARRRSAILRFAPALAVAGIVAVGMIASPAAEASSSSASAAASPSSAVAKVSGEPAQGLFDPHDGHYCDGCRPPLEYSGGPTMDTKTIEVTPIYWGPDGAQPFPDGYVDGINQYVTDIAAASGQQDNVYSVTGEYYDQTSGSQTPLTYQVTAGTPVTDTAAFPENGCTPDSDATPICLTDDQLRTELAQLIKDQGLPTGMGEFYPVFFPPGVETQDRDGTTSTSTFCGYHRMFGDSPNEIVYGNEPYEESNCDAGQHPNGSLALDGGISTLSHELNESMTDPDGDSPAWLDRTGHEIGDICAEDFGTALGSTDPSNPFETEYNQVINGHYYYTQTEFSNAAFKKYGQGYGCAQSAQQASTDPSKTPEDIAQVFSDVTPNATTSGKDKVELSATVYNRAGDPVEGDRVSFTTYAVSGDGTCGSFSEASGMTDAQGNVTTSYTGSSGNATCALVALEAKGGHSAISRVYQGTASETAPQATATFPDTLQPGAAAKTFTTTFTNPTKETIHSGQVEIDVYPADNATIPVDSSKLHLSYSTTGPGGPFLPVELSGSTKDGGVVYGFVDPADGLTLDPHSEMTIYYQVSVDAGVSTHATKPQLSLEAYLDQVNPASGAGTTIADTYATDVRLTAATPWFLDPLLIAGFLTALIAIIVGVIAVYRRHESRP